MGDTNLLAQVSLGLGGFGAGFSAVNAANEARVHRRVTELNVADARNRGAQQEIALRRQGKKLAGAQRARLAAGNVDVGEGSALDILEDTAKGVGEDVRVTRDNTRREVAGIRAQRGPSPLAAGTASLLTSANAVASRWYRFSDSGEPTEEGE